MNRWVRGVIAVVAGFVTWFVVATLGNLLMRAAMPGYEQVEKAMNFTLAMMLARLVLGAVSSLAAGAACAGIARRDRWPVIALAIVTLVLFVPVHIGLWDKFPWWYHLVFLGSIVPLVMLGARLVCQPPDAG